MRADGKPEILAPAGGPAAFAAALAAGADAVYIGLGELDARRGAEGFEVKQLPKLVEQAHAAGARVHLTLNIQLATRELGRAARTLAWAEQSGVDAVLIADPGLLDVMAAFPRLEMHWSTQSGVSSSAGVRAAAALGVRRVVLAREMSLDEIAPCTRIGPEIEVFAQGALCFAVSGRCTMTSWVGGRSGSRGTCTSICRVNWSCNGGEHARPLDMKDSSAVRVLPQLMELGVASLKIEGRLKTAEWVSQAVSLYRRGTDGAVTADELWHEAEELGTYTGRDMTDAYFDGRRSGLVHPDEGRAASTAPQCDDQDPPRELRVTCEAIGKQLTWTVSCGARHETFTSNRPVAHPGRDATWADLRERIISGLPADIALVACEDHSGGLRLPRRTANEIAARILLISRPREDGIDRLRIVIPEAARTQLANRPAHSENIRTQRDVPDRLRCDLDAVARVVAGIAQVPMAVEVRNVTELEQAVAAVGARLIAALPPVVYEAMLADLAAVCTRCARDGLAIEANGWDSWQLAREAGCTRLSAGPGLAVLNPLAARALHARGCATIHIHPEIDDGKLADLCAGADVPLVLTVFGRPALMQTRAWSKAPPWQMEDARGSIRIAPRQEGPVVALRPTAPFDWRGLPLPGAHVAHIEMDLCASPDPVAEWSSRRDPAAHRYNLGRELA
jgi:U32 family peptidase